MASCEFSGSCNFFNEQATVTSNTKEHLKRLYCNEVSFTECAIYLISKMYGEDKVPKRLCPNDVHKLLDFKLFETSGDSNMRLDVIYTDGTSGKIKSTTLEGAKKSGKIIAFHCSEGWVDARPKSKSTYNGVERRRSDLEKFLNNYSV